MVSDDDITVPILRAIRDDAQSRATRMPTISGSTSPGRGPAAPARSPVAPARTIDVPSKDSVVP